MTDAESDSVEQVEPEALTAGRPKWLAEKFESPEALAKSYADLERQFTKSREQSKAMEENYSTLAQQAEELGAENSELRELAANSIAMGRELAKVGRG